MESPDIVIIGDLLNVTDGIICHQVNCRRVAGTGLALQIRNRWPEWHDVFRANRPHLGDIHYWRADTNLIIASLYSQYDYGRSQRRTNYAALGSCMMMLRNFDNMDNKHICFPYFYGCGLGGGDWEIVRQIITDALPDAVFIKRGE